MNRTGLVTRNTVLLVVTILVAIPAAIFLYVYKTRYEPVSHVSKAQQGCKHLDQAIEQYIGHPANPRHELPDSLDDLDHPPWGGPSLHPLGDTSRPDPWGKPYQMESATKSNGDKYIIVKTTAPDGTPISQFGIGPGAKPME